MNHSLTLHRVRFAGLIPSNQAGQLRAQLCTESNASLLLCDLLALSENVSRSRESGV